MLSATIQLELQLQPQLPELPIAWHSPGHVAETDEQAREEFFPAQAHNHAVIGRERGWPPLSREAFEQMAGPDGAYYVGSPETVARKIVRHQKALGAARFDLKYANGTVAHEHLMQSIELYGTQVIPRVRELLERVGLAVFLEPKAGIFVWARPPGLDDAGALDDGGGYEEEI